MVRREGCPGPEPTNRIRPFLGGVSEGKEGRLDWDELLACGRASINEDMYYDEIVISDDGGKHNMDGPWVDLKFCVFLNWQPPLCQLARRLANYLIDSSISVKHRATRIWQLLTLMFLHLSLPYSCQNLNPPTMVSGVIGWDYWSWDYFQRRLGHVRFRDKV